MVEVRVPRFAVEVLSTSDTFQGLHRIDAEALSGEGGSAEVRVPRFAIEVLERIPANQRLDRLDAEALSGEDGTSEIQVPRFAMEVIETPPRTQALHRLDAEALSGEDGSAEVRVPRFAIELLIRSGPTTGTLLPLPVGLDFSKHNWNSKVTLETAYLTDVTESVRTLAEDRTGLLEKPNRLLEIVWQRFERTAMDRLYATLRRMTQERLVTPIICDMTCITATSSVATTTLWCDTTTRRFAVGARIVIYPIQQSPHIASADAKVYVVAEILPDRLILTSTLSETWTRGWVFPVLSTDFVLEPKLTHLSRDVATASLTLQEILGDSTLPPAMTGHPEEYDQVDGMPIFDAAHNWESNVDTADVRAGERYGAGRGSRTYLRGPRYYQVQDYKTLFLNRESFWRFFRFFDSRRGRLRPFLAIDVECVWEVINVTSSFIEVQALGSFDEFSVGMDYFGVVLNNGQHIVRRVNTIQNLGSTWRITTTGANWPAFGPTDVHRAARARVSRFVRDAIREVWSTLNVVNIDFTIRELLNERERTLEP